MIEPIRVTPYSLASRFIGLKEVPGTASNPAILAMLNLDTNWPKDDDVPWCSAFLNYVFWLLRLPRSKSLMARSWLEVGTPTGLPMAEPGFDVVVFLRGASPTAGHVALYAGFDGDNRNVLCLGGNQSNSVSVAPYPADRLLGIRRITP